MPPGIIGGARQVALFITIVALAMPLLLNLFIRLDYDRYIWVITQPGRCGYLGSGPLFVWIGLQSWLIAFAAFVSLVLTRSAKPRLVPSVGLLAGAGVVAVGAVLVFTQPQLVAYLLGCSR